MISICFFNGNNDKFRLLFKTQPIFKIKQQDVIKDLIISFCLTLKKSLDLDVWQFNVFEDNWIATHQGKERSYVFFVGSLKR